MHFGYSILVRRFDQAKNVFPFFIYPISHAFTFMLILVQQISVVRFSNILCFNAGNNMYIHVDWHQDPL